MANCNDPNKNCPCLIEGVCQSKMPGYCYFYPKEEVKAPTVKKAETPRLEVGSEMWKWAHQDFEERIMAKT